MIDKIIQITTGTVYGDNEPYTLIYGLSQSGDLYEMLPPNEKWEYIGESPEK